MQIIDNPKTWDVFISHASEDEDFVRPLAVALQSLGVSVWYAEFSLRLGDSLSGSIDKGLSSSRFGLVVISQHFIKKFWPERELRGLISREIEEGRVILPIWYGITRQQVVSFSPTLADKVALITEGLPSQDIAIQVLLEVRPDLYAKHPRAKLERIASGEALRDLQQEINRTQHELEEAREELAEYRCPYCGAPLISRLDAPADPEEKSWDIRENFTCGYQVFGGNIERPCPYDPKFPRFEEYELQCHHSPDEPNWPWQCFAVGKTDMARRLNLQPGYGRTRDEAEANIREWYDRYASRKVK
ncbi:MAG: TIR domain-containing protein [Desulfobaccales bacterium]